MTRLAAIDLTLVYPPMFFSSGADESMPILAAVTVDATGMIGASCGEPVIVCEAEDLACGPPLISWVETHYLMLDYAAVAHYLFENHGLYAVLMELWSQARSHFGASTTIALEVCHDEEVQEYTRLYATIITAHSSAEALARLDALHEGWWLDKMPSTGGRLNIGIRHLV